MKTRRASIKLFYEGVDISEDISADQIEFSYNDNEDGKADDISIKLHDHRGDWSGDWYPAKGATIEATIIDEGFGELYCGKFEIDKLSLSGPPDVFNIGAVSVPISNDLRGLPKDKAWESVTLEEIANQIGGEYGMQIIYDVDSTVSFDRLDQRGESDLTFLNRICKNEAFSLKVTDKKIVIFSQEKYEDGEPYTTIIRGQSNLLNYSFESKSRDVYKSCTVSYQDPNTEELISKTYNDPNVETGQNYRMNKRASSPDEAERWAKAKLRELNKFAVTGQLTLVGDVDLGSGMILDLQEFGVYSAKYIISKCTHSPTGGYTMNLDIRKVLEGY